MGNSVEKPFTCEICLEPMLLPSKKFKNKNRCDHPYCSDCMIKFIQLKISENVAKIKCPALDCEALLDPLYCRPIMTHQLFDKWCDLIFEDKILGLEHCYCPNTNCSALIVNECGGIVKKSQCPNCKGVFCFECKLRWHEGFECKFRDRNDIAFGVLVERENWKRCPHCHHFVERSGGCRLITCRCHTSFCYKCGGEVDGDVCDCRRSCTSWIGRALLFQALVCNIAMISWLFW